MAKIILFLLLCSQLVYAQDRYFDGDDYFTVPDSDNYSLDTSNYLTVELQVKFVAEPGDFSVIINSGQGDDGEWLMRMNNDGTTFVGVFYNSTEGPYLIVNYAASGVADGNWHHVAMAGQLGVRLDLYVDGKLVGSDVTIDGVYVDKAVIVTVGAQGISGPYRYVTGWIDEVRIWSTKRTQLQLESNMDKVVADEEPGLVGYWQMDELTGGLFDKTANKNHSTVVSGTLSADNAMIKRIIGE